MTESSCRLEVVRCLTMLCYLGYYITGGVEYCWEDFNATCADDEVIMMQTAFYGRMEQGRCLPQDQQLGCRDNIITYMDSRCSGRQSCVQPVPDKNLQILSSCPQMMSYLNATYSCIKVAYPKKSSPLHCSKASRSILNETAGYISSHVSLVTLTGTTSCPWVISVPKGQKVNLTLVDFSVSEGMSGSEDICAMYAKLRDGVRKTADITVCGGEVREKGIYLSDSHSVEIEINAALSHNTVHMPHFVIKYQAVGCPDLVAPPGGWLERHDHKMALGCNDTGEVRHLVCSDNSWVGEISNCSGAHLTSANGAHGFVRKEVPFGLVLAIVIGVVLGIIIGSLLLGVVLYTQNRLKHRRGAGFTGNATDQEKRQILQSGNYGYAHVWELQQLRGSPGSPGGQDPQNPPTTQPTNICPREFGTHLGKPPGFPPAQISHKDHSYESPRFSAGHSHGHGHTHIIPRNTESSGTLIPKCHEFDVHIKTTVGGNTGVAPPRQQETNTEARYSE